MLIIVATTLLGWTAYLAGEALHVSGVISAVTAGLILGWFQHTVMSASVRLIGGSFWQILNFILEAMVFILIGFSLRGALERIGGTVAITRFVWVFGQESILGVLRKAGLKTARPLGWRQASVLSWAGMRGVVTLAVPLTLPVDMPGRDLMLICAFAVIFVTVVGQGASLGWLIRKIQPQDLDPPARMDMPATEAAMARARTARVEELAYAPDGTLIHPQLLQQHQKRLDMIERYAQNAPAAMEMLRPHFDVLISAVGASRAELIRLHREGHIEDEVLHELERDLDVEELGMVLQRGED
jgi:NhaP-type Na+/H+ and K+/H+ antiporter